MTKAPLTQDPKILKPPTNYVESTQLTSEGAWWLPDHMVRCEREDEGQNPPPVSSCIRLLSLYALSFHVSLPRSCVK